jgi:hypothetical protein
MMTPTTMVIEKHDFEFTAPERLFKNVLALEIAMLPADLRLAMLTTLLFEEVTPEIDND